MADKKISELTALTSPDGAEELVVNDSGVSKKIAIDNLFAGTGRVGINTSSPSEPLTVNGGTSANTVAKFYSEAANTYIRIDDSTSNGGNFIGVNGDNLHFWTNNTERLRIDSSGNIGIGTASPGANLHVKGNGGVARFEGSDHAYMEWYPKGASNGRKGYIGYGSPGNTDIMLYNENSGSNIQLGTNGSERLRITSSGNVGIGTSSPSAKLDVETGNTTAKIRLGNTSGAHYAELYTDVNGVTIIDSNVDNVAGGSFRIRNGGSERLRIDSSGRVGIGTSSPSEKLHVAGGNLKIGRPNQLIGGIGARSTSGTTDWNDSTNARSGNGYTLLLGSATNGMGGGSYYYSFCYEYANSGNMTQIAIPYATSQQYTRYRYSGTWSSWVSI